MKKIIFKKIKKVQILFLDENYSKLKIINHTKDQVNFNEINLYCLPYILKNLLDNFFLLSLKDIYLKSIIQAHAPKVVIDHSINGRALRVKKFLNNIYCITYQHSFFYENEKKIYRERFKDSSCDLFITYSNKDANFLSKFIKSKFISLGSLKNNEISLRNERKKISVLLVSEYRTQKKSKKETLHFKKFKEIVNITRIFCEKKKLVPYVALCSSRDDKKIYNMFNEEILFFRKHLGKFNFEKRNSYNLSNKSKLIINLSSNLGIELLARGLKTVLVNLIGKIDKKQIYPYYPIKKTFFILNYPQNKIIRNLNTIYNMKQKTWKKKIKQFDHINFDNNNKKFKNLINKIINNS